MTPLILLVGFLGAGKTTFLKAVLPALQQNGVKPHVLINDYQNAGVDAEQLRGLAQEISAISGDCVCCGSRDELLAALTKFPHGPGHLVLVETNGTTDSENLIEMLALEPDLREFSLPVQLSIIDSQRWQKRFWHNRLEREQARTGSHLFLSRSDTVPAARLEDVERSLDKLHIAGRRVTISSFAQELASLTQDLASEGARNFTGPDPHHHHHKAASDHHFASLELSLPNKTSRAALDDLLRNLPEEVIRTKGLVRFDETPEELFVFQKVDRSDTPQFFPLGESARITTPLILFIGPNLPENTLSAAVSALKKKS
jgi:G3E family GTPase